MGKNDIFNNKNNCNSHITYVGLGMMTWIKAIERLTEGSLVMLCIVAINGIKEFFSHVPEVIKNIRELGED